MTVKILENGVLARVMKKNHKEDKLVSHLEDYGIYSYKTPSLMFQFLGLSYHVYGRIENWGGMEHEIGYRANKIVIQELCLIAPYNKFSDDIKVNLERIYDCPVHVCTLTTLKDWANQQEKEWCSNGNR